MSSSPLSGPRATKKCVLVVDDVDDIRDTIRDVLELEGYEVAVAASGEEALMHLRSGVRPCVILLDLMMPGMNGWELRHELLLDEALRDIPVVVLSGDGHVAQKAASLAAVTYLKKPIALDDLLSVVEKT